jgi:hypothetical protein
MARRAGHWLESQFDPHDGVSAVTELEMLLRCRQQTRESHQQGDVAGAAYAAAEDTAMF